MVELKTARNNRSVPAFLKSVPDEQRRKECAALVALMRRVTKAPPRMWGSSIIGFGTYHYVYDSGREGDWFLTGFSPRKQALTIYVMSGFDESRELLAELGKHKTGRSCLYVRNLSDIRRDVLEKLLLHSLRQLRAQQRQSVG